MGKDKAAKIAEYKAAKKAQAANQAREKKAGIRRETAAFHRANDRTAAAQAALPWWRR